MPKVISYETVKNYIENEIGLGYKLLSTEYKGNSKPLDIWCPKGHTFHKNYAEMKQGKTSCNICSPQRHTYESVKDYIENQLGRGYKLLSTSYKNNNTALQLECGEGHKFSETYVALKSYNARCPECYHRNYTYEDVKQFIEDELGYKLISTEFKTKTPLTVQCDKGHEFYPLFDTMKNQGTRCPFCKKCRVTYDMVKERIESEEGYVLVSTEYKSSKDKLHIQCNNGHDFQMTLTDFSSGYRCPVCYRLSVTKTHEQYVKDVFELVGNEYDVLTEYTTTQGKVDIRHNLCNHIYSVKATSFLQGYRCPKCAASKGEKSISDYLTKEQISYKQEYFFKDLIGFGKAPLRFDFAVFDSNNKLSALIEYDGIFHFVDVMGKNLLKNQQANDTRKNEYCAKHNIPLIRIHYKDYENIETILDEVIPKLLHNKGA